ncbi:hypothetical protein N8841_04750 [Candidatus Pelagibacter sp.]|nr:hypothetical protein [Candidatus Pelagibacter sp.]
MSAEKILDTGIKNLPHLETSQKGEEVILGRVDINVLLERARKVEEKETRINLVFGGLIVSLIFVVGLILSF